MYKIPIKNLINREKENIINNYNNGLSSDKIAKKIGYSPVAVRKFLRFSGIKIRNRSECHRKYNINENLFNQIDTHEKAYFLGLLYADGYICEKTKSIHLTLSGKDKEVLERLNKLLESNRPLLFINFEKQRKNGKNIQDSNRLSINNIKIYNRLLEYGLFQKKSLLLKFPNSDIIPNKFLNSFILGYFDGDGSQTIYYPNRKGVKSKTMQSDVKILGTLEFIQEGIIRFNKVNSCKINFRIGKRFKDEVNCYSWEICGNLQVLEFLSYLYLKTSKIKLIRKLDKFKKFITILKTQKSNNKTKIFLSNLEKGI